MTPAARKAVMTGICTALLGAMATDALAQKALPNPLIQPPKRGAPGGAAPSGAPEGASQEGAAPAGQSAGKEAGSDQDSALKDMLGKLGALYVSAIIGDVAVLRTSTGGAASAGGAAGGATGGGQAGGGAGGATTGSGARAPVYFVRDAEPFHIFDRYRLLPRIQDTTVLLYLISDSPQDAGKRAQIVFRSTLDSVSTQPYTPPKLEAIGSGDGGAYQGLINVGSGGGGGAKPGAATGGAAK